MIMFKLIQIYLLSKKKNSIFFYMHIRYDVLRFKFKQNDAILYPIYTKN